MKGPWRSCVTTYLGWPRRHLDRLSGEGRHLAPDGVDDFGQQDGRGGVASVASEGPESYVSESSGQIILIPNREIMRALVDSSN